MQLFVGREAVIFCNVTSWTPLTVKWLMVISTFQYPLLKKEKKLKVSSHHCTFLKSTYVMLGSSAVKPRTCTTQRSAIFKYRSPVRELWSSFLFCLVTHLSDRQINESVINLSQMKIGKVTDDCQFSKFPH